MRTLIALILLAGVAAAAEPMILKVDPPNVVRGSSLTLTLDVKPSGDRMLWLKATSPMPPAMDSSRKSDDMPFGPFPLTTVTDTTYRAQLPATMPLGPYEAWIAAPLKEGETAARPPVTVPIKVTRSAGPAPVLREVDPTTSYPGQKSYVLLGENFSSVGEDHVLLIVGKDEIRLKPAPSVDATMDAGVVVHSPNKLEIFGKRFAEERLEGRQLVRLRVGEETSAGSTPITFARYQRRTPLVLAGIVIGLLVLAIGWAAGAFVRKRGPTQNKNWNWVVTLLTDSETNSLSLSKFQLFAWTAAAVFGYAFLTASRVLIQGVLEFPPIPENLPGLLLVSISTTAVATGITAARGPKGAGEDQPSAADLITVGGVVSAERFQFLVWTILGILAFVFVVVSSDPARIDTLPKVPESFLLLMGASSSGYLAGKLTRRPGPNIDSVVANEGSLVIEVRGRRLARDAKFEIEGKPVVTRKPKETTPAADPNRAAAAGAAAASPVEATMTILADDPESKEDYASAMRITIPDPVGWATINGVTKSLKPQPSPSSETELKLTIINPDGQAASKPFQVRPVKPST